MSSGKKQTKSNNPRSKSKQRKSNKQISRTETGSRSRNMRRSTKTEQRTGETDIELAKKHQGTQRLKTQVKIEQQDTAETNQGGTDNQNWWEIQRQEATQNMEMVNCKIKQHTLNKKLKTMTLNCTLIFAHYFFCFILK